MNINVVTLELKTARDFRGLGYDLNKAMEKIILLDYGIYKIAKEHKHLFLIIENMDSFQEKYNKGVRIIGGFDTQKVEIYDYAQERKDLDFMTLDINL